MAGKVRRKVAGLHKREMKIAVNEGRWQLEVITPSVRPNGRVRRQVENAVGLNPNSEQQADQKRGFDKSRGLAPCERPRDLYLTRGSLSRRRVRHSIGLAALFSET